MADSARNFKNIRDCNTAVAGSDPPDVRASGAVWETAPRQNTLQTSHDVYIAPSTDSRQPQSCDNVVKLPSLDLQACAIALTNDDVRHVHIEDTMLAYRVANGFHIEAHEAARIIRLFRERRNALSETLRLYEEAR